jgi:hypothetical protein
MYSLERIIEQNREAVRVGVAKAGEAVGTEGYVPSGSYSVVASTAGENGELTAWTVTNTKTGEKFNTYISRPYGGACALAHTEADQRSSGRSFPRFVNAVRVEV